MPASENIITIITNAYTGLRWFRPLKSSSVSASKSLRPTSITTPNEPSVVTSYTMLWHLPETYALQGERLRAPTTISVIDVGRPWVTSGTPIWNGTGPILHAIPAAMKITPNSSTAPLMRPDATPFNTSFSSSEPVAP